MNRHDDVVARITDYIIYSINMEAPPLVARTVVRLGIVGGGQLGRMLALSAHSLGVRVTCLEAGGSASPAGQVADTIDGALSNVEALRELASRSDVLTVEIEHVDVDALESVAAAANIPVHPSPGTLRLIQDKYAQKCFFRDSEVPLGQFIDIPSEAALKSAIEVSLCRTARAKWAHTLSPPSLPTTGFRASFDA